MVFGCLRRVFLLMPIATLFGVLNAQNDTDTYLGCYNDSRGDSFQERPVFERRTTSPYMTPDDCRWHCRRNNIAFAGLLGGDTCVCADQQLLSKTSILTNSNDSECSVSCTGDLSQICGGKWNSRMYSIYSSCPIGKFGYNCNRNCYCKDDEPCLISGNCSGSECAPGWKQPSCSFDVDECEAECNSTDDTNCHSCNATNGEGCNNTVGSFHCICLNGFFKENGKCIDVDECVRGKSGCNQQCVNTIGNYKCACFAGFKLRDNYTCVDINECDRSDGGCTQLCSNTDGSYRCGCKKGYQLDSDQHSCYDVDECSRGQSRCAQQCINTVGGYNCSCFAGFEPRDNYTCVDINECELVNPCDHICINHDGNYSCACVKGFYLARDFKTCHGSDLLFEAGLGIQAVIIVILMTIVIALLKKIQKISQSHGDRSTTEDEMNTYTSLKPLTAAEDVYTVVKSVNVGILSENEVYANVDSTNSKRE